MYMTAERFVEEVAKRVRMEREESGLSANVCIDSVRTSYVAGLSIETAARIAAQDTEYWEGN
jgi:hypothetical protein